MATDFLADTGVSPPEENKKKKPVISGKGFDYLGSAPVQYPNNAPGSDLPEINMVVPPGVDAKKFAEDVLAGKVPLYNKVRVPAKPLDTPMRIPAPPPSPVKRTVMEALRETGINIGRGMTNAAIDEAEAARIAFNLASSMATVPIAGAVAAPQATFAALKGIEDTLKNTAAVKAIDKIMPTPAPQPAWKNADAGKVLIGASKTLEGVSSLAPRLEPRTKEQAKQEEQVGEVAMLPFKTAGLGWGGIVEALSTGDINKAVDVIEGRSEGSNIFVPLAKALGEADAVFAIPGVKKVFKTRVLGTNWFRRLTIKERGLVTQALDDIVGSNMSLAEAARKYPEIFKSELAKRMAGEQPVTSKPTEAVKPSEVKAKSEAGVAAKTKPTVVATPPSAPVVETAAVGGVAAGAKPKVVGLSNEEVAEIRKAAEEKRVADEAAKKGKVTAPVVDKVTGGIDLLAEGGVSERSKIDQPVVGKVTDVEAAPAKQLKPSGYEPTHSLFNKPELRNNTTFAWRSMGEKEYNKLIAGEKEYLGSKQASKGNFLAGIPESAGQFGGKGKYLVEFGGVKIAGDEGLLPGSKATRDNITKVWKYDTKESKWVETKRVVSNETPLSASKVKDNVVDLIPKPEREAHTKLMGEIGKGVKANKALVDAWGGWQWDIGDRVIGSTKRPLTITGKYWDTIKDRPMYSYEYKPDGEKGALIAVESHNKMTKLGGPEPTELVSKSELAKVGEPKLNALGTYGNDIVDQFATGIIDQAKKIDEALSKPVNEILSSDTTEVADNNITITEPKVKKTVKLVQARIDSALNNPIKFVNGKAVITVKAGRAGKERMDITNQMVQLKRDVSNGNPSRVIVTELIQNVLDAVRANERAYGIDNRTIDIRAVNVVKDKAALIAVNAEISKHSGEKWTIYNKVPGRGIDDSMKTPEYKEWQAEEERLIEKRRALYDRSVSFTDYGVGMTPQHVAEHFLTTATEGTKGVEDSGAQGIGKTVILGWPANWDLETVAIDPLTKQKVRTTIAGDATSFLNGQLDDFPINSEIVPDSTPTMTRFTFNPPEVEDWNDVLKNVEDMRFNLLFKSKLRITTKSNVVKVGDKVKYHRNYEPDIEREGIVQYVDNDDIKVEGYDNYIRLSNVIEDTSSPKERTVTHHINSLDELPGIYNIDKEVTVNGNIFRIKTVELGADEKAHLGFQQLVGALFGKSVNISVPFAISNKQVPLNISSIGLSELRKVPDFKVYVDFTKTQSQYLTDSKGNKYENPDYPFRNNRIEIARPIREAIAKEVNDLVRDLNAGKDREAVSEFRGALSRIAPIHGVDIFAGYADEVSVNKVKDLVAKNEVILTDVAKLLGDFKALVNRRWNVVLEVGICFMPYKKDSNGYTLGFRPSGSFGYNGFFISVFQFEEALNAVKSSAWKEAIEADNESTDWIDTPRKQFTVEDATGITDTDTGEYTYRFGDLTSTNKDPFERYKVVEDRGVYVTFDSGTGDRVLDANGNYTTASLKLAVEAINNRQRLNPISQVDPKSQPMQNKFLGIMSLKTLIHEDAHVYVGSHGAPFHNKMDDLEISLMLDDLYMPLADNWRKFYELHRPGISDIANEIKAISETGDKLSIFGDSIQRDGGYITIGETAVSQASPSIEENTRGVESGRQVGSASEGEGRLQEPKVRSHEEVRAVRKENKDTFVNWLTGEGERPTAPKVHYRGTSEKGNIENKGKFTHVTPWLDVADRGGMLMGGGNYAVTEYPVQPNHMYYRGGSLAGDPLEGTEIGNVEGQTWDEALDKAKDLYDKRVAKRLAEYKRMGKDFFARANMPDRLADMKEAIAEDTFGDFKNAVFEADVTNIPGKWKGRPDIPKDFNKRLPKLRSNTQVARHEAKYRKLLNKVASILNNESGAITTDPNRVGFTSKLKDVATFKTSGKMEVGQLKKMLANNGVTKDEINDVLGDFKDYETVTKKQVLEEIEVKGIKLKTVVLGGPKEVVTSTESVDNTDQYTTDRFIADLRERGYIVEVNANGDIDHVLRGRGRALIPFDGWTEEEIRGHYEDLTSEAPTDDMSIEEIKNAISEMEVGELADDTGIITNRFPGDTAEKFQEDYEEFARRNNLALDEPFDFIDRGVLSEEDRLLLDELESRYFELQDNNGFDIGAVPTPATRVVLEVDPFDPPADIEDIYDRYADYRNSLEDVQDPNRTRFPQHTLPGGVENSYRELFVTAPNVNIAPSIRLPISYYEGLTDYQLGIEYSDITGYDATSRANMLREIEAGLNEERTWRDGHSAYDSIKNPIVRIRYDDRLINGKKILFIQEMQGPTGDTKWVARTKVEGTTSKAFVDSKVFDTKSRAEKYIETETHELPGLVGSVEKVVEGNQGKMRPSLQSRIYDIGVKKVIQLAKEGNYDGIAWTSGEMQAERNRLSVQVDSIDWEPVVNFFDATGKLHYQEQFIRRVNLNTKNRGSYEIGINNKGTVISGSTMFLDHSLEEVIGKELAAKVMNRESGTVSGLDLDFGGEGLKSLYDNTLPSMFKKYGKGEVGEIGITGKDSNILDLYSIRDNNLFTLKDNLRLAEEELEDILAHSKLFKEKKDTDLLNRKLLGVKYLSEKLDNLDGEYNVVRDSNLGRIIEEFSPETFPDKKDIVPYMPITSKTPSTHTLYSGVDPIVALKSLGKTVEDLNKGVKLLEKVGRKIYEEGNKNYTDWSTAFKNKLGELWERFKDFLGDIWDRRAEWIGSEKGAVGKDINAKKKKDIKDGKRDINVGEKDENGNIIAHQRLIRVSQKTKLEIAIEQLQKALETANNELESVKGIDGKAKFDKLKAERVNALIDRMSKLKTEAEKAEAIGYARAIEETKALERVEHIERLEKVVEKLYKTLGELGIEALTTKDNVDTVAPPVLKKDLDLLMSLKDRNMYVPFGGQTVNPIFNFERWGNQNQAEAFKKAFKDKQPIPYDKTTSKAILDVFYHPFVDARNIADRAFEKLWNEAKEVRKHLPLGSAKRIGIYSIAQQVHPDPRKSGQTILDAMGITKDKVPVLTPDEMKVYNWMQDKYKQAFELLNNARIASGLRPFAKVENYHKFAADLNFAEKLKFGLDDQYIIDNMKASATDFASAKKRVGGLEKVHLDAFKVFDKYMKNAFDHIYLSPEIAKMRELVEVKHSWKEDGVGKNGKAVKITHRYTMKRRQPRMYKDISEYINTVAGRKKVLLPKAIEKGMSVLRNNLVTAFLSASLRSALIQPAALLNTYTSLGPKHIFGGTIDMIGKTRREALEESKVLKYRNMDLNVQEATSGATGAITSAREWFNQNLGMAPLRWLDKGTATITRMAAKSYAKDELGLNEADANRYADDLVIKTQSSAALHDLPPILRYEIGRTLMTLQSFVITNWNWLLRDVMGVSNPSVRTSRMLHLVMRFVLGLAILNTIYEDGFGLNSPMPSPVREAVKSYEKDKSTPRAALNATLEMLQFIPGMGGFRYGSTMLGAPIDYIGDLGKKIAELSGGYVGPTKSVLELAGTGLGVPGTKQVARSIGAYTKGADTPSSILGAYPKKKSGKLLPSGSGSLRGDFKKNRLIK